MTKPRLTLVRLVIGLSCLNIVMGFSFAIFFVLDTLHVVPQEDTGVFVGESERWVRGIHCFIYVNGDRVGPISYKSPSSCLNIWKPRQRIAFKYRVGKYSKSAFPYEWPKSFREIPSDK